MSEPVEKEMRWGVEIFGFIGVVENSLSGKCHVRMNCGQLVHPRTWWWYLDDNLACVFLFLVLRLFDKQSQKRLVPGS